MIAFAVNIYRDEALALRLARQIRRHYPEAHLVFVHDRDRLKLRRTGEWTARYLRLALSTDAETIIKIDPDACLWRRFVVPDAAWFGVPTLSGVFLRGGAVGFSRATAETLLASGQLLAESKHIYSRYGAFRWPHELEDDTLISCQDRIVGDVMQSLGIGWSRWEDVHDLGNAMTVAERGNHAISHPHPTIALDD